MKHVWTAGLALALGGLAVLGSAAQTPDAMPDAPPILPTEVLVYMADGCALVADMKTESRPLPTIRQTYASMVAGAACRAGLYEGSGYVMGRRMLQAYDAGYYLDRIVREGGQVRYGDPKLQRSTVLPDRADPYAPNWPAKPKGGKTAAGAKLETPHREGETYRFIEARYDSCLLFPSVRGCNQLFQSNAYGIVLYEVRNGVFDLRNSMNCPDDKKPAETCQAVWDRWAGPIIEANKQFVAEFEKAAAEKQRQLDDLNAKNQQWVANYPAMVERSKATLGPKASESIAQFDTRLTQLASAEASAIAARAAEQARIADENRRLGPPLFSSTCMRDWQKIQDTLFREQPAGTAATSNELWLIDVQNYGVQLMNRCASDPAAGEQARKASAEAARIRNYCNGPHQSWECKQWGTNNITTAGVNADVLAQGYYRIFKREADKALADPSYSNDLGRAGSGGYVMDDKGAHACLVKMQDLGKQMREADARIGQDEIVRRAELVMWYTREARSFILAACSSAPEYAAEANSFQATFDNTQRTCNQVATSVCQPRLP